MDVLMATCGQQTLELDDYTISGFRSMTVLA